VLQEAQQYRHSNSSGWSVSYTSTIPRHTISGLGELSGAQEHGNSLHGLDCHLPACALQRQCMTSPTVLLLPHVYQQPGKHLAGLGTSCSWYLHSARLQRL